MLSTFCRAALIAAFLVCSTSASYGFVIRGIGTDALVGPAGGGLEGDLTNPGNDGDEAGYVPRRGLFGGFTAEFFSSEEEGFGGGEFAFNVFDNLVGGGNDKWCCGTVTDGVPSFPLIVGANLLGDPQILQSFTLASGNDSPARRPRVWSIDGSNDGVDWTTIYQHDDPESEGNDLLWTENDQVALFRGGEGEDEFGAFDFAIPETAYQQFRLNVTATGSTTGAFFQVGELELFNFVAPVPEPSSLMLVGFGLLGLSAVRRRTNR